MQSQKGNRCGTKHLHRHHTATSQELTYSDYPGIVGWREPETVVLSLVRHRVTPWALQARWLASPLH